jgi:hypothetical protein
LAQIDLVTLVGVDFNCFASQVALKVIVSDRKKEKIILKVTMGDLFTSLDYSHRRDLGTLFLDLRSH